MRIYTLIISALAVVTAQAGPVDINKAKALAQKYPGGGDIGERLDEPERKLIQSFVQSGRPILGICRGFVVMPVTPRPPRFCAR